jgi:hypothetical protein
MPAAPLLTRRGARPIEGAHKGASHLAAALPLPLLCHGRPQVGEREGQAEGVEAVRAQPVRDRRHVQRRSIPARPQRVHLCCAIVVHPKPGNAMGFWHFPKPGLRRLCCGTAMLGRLRRAAQRACSGGAACTRGAAPQLCLESSSGGDSLLSPAYGFHLHARAVLVAHDARVLQLDRVRWRPARGWICIVTILLEQKCRLGALKRSIPAPLDLGARA